MFICLMDCNVYWLNFWPHVVSGVERIGLLHFLAGCRKRRLNQALSFLRFSECVLCCLLGPLFVLMFVFLCVLSLDCCWLSCQYLPSDWLERLLWGCLYAIRILSSKSPGQRALMTFSLLYCFFVLLCICLLSQPYTIYFILLCDAICW